MVKPKKGFQTVCFMSQLWAVGVATLAIEGIFPAPPDPDTSCFLPDDGRGRNMTREMSEYPFASLHFRRSGSREKLVPIYGAGLD